MTIWIVNIGFANIGCMNIGFVNAGFVHIGFVNIGFVNIGFVNIGFVNMGFVNIGFVCIGFEKHGLLLSQYGWPVKRNFVLRPGLIMMSCETSRLLCRSDLAQGLAFGAFQLVIHAVFDHVRFDAARA